MINSKPMTPDAWNQLWQGMRWHEKLRVMLAGAYFAARDDLAEPQEPVIGEGLRRITLLRGELEPRPTKPN